MSEIKMIIDMTRQQQVEIEELCINAGISPSSYMMGLHENAKVSALKELKESYDNSSLPDLINKEKKEIDDEQAQEQPRKKKHSK